MSKHRHDRHPLDDSGVHHEHIPYWKRAHNDWRFWVGVILMFAAMIVYVMTGNLAVRPRLEAPPPMSDAVGK